MISDQNKKYMTLVSGAAFTNGNTATAYVDLIGVDYATLHINVALGATATIASADGVTLSVATSDTTHASAFATIAANDTGNKTTFNAHYLIDTKIAKRYLKVLVSPGTSGVSNEVATVCVMGSFSRLADSPNGTATMVLTTNDSSPASNTNDVVTIVT